MSCPCRVLLIHTPEQGIYFQFAASKWGSKLEMLQKTPGQKYTLAWSPYSQAHCLRTCFSSLISTHTFRSSPAKFSLIVQVQSGETNRIGGRNIFLSFEVQRFQPLEQLKTLTIVTTIWRLQSVSWSLAEFRHNKIVQLLRENCFNVCRQLQRKVTSRKHDV